MSRLADVLRRGAARLRPPAGSPPYEPDVAAAIREHVRSGATCVDVGAHVGIITRLLADVAGATGRVVAFEAHPGNAERLRAALAREGYANVEVEHAAVSDGSAATATLYGGRDERSAEWNIVGRDVAGAATGAAATVPAVALDAWFAAGERVDFVKVDVEGAEALVLAGMRRLLIEARPVVLVEFHDDAGWEGRRELLDRGYALCTLDGAPVPEDAGRVYHCIAFPAPAAS